MKVGVKIYKGIEYVQVSELPAAQREDIGKTLNPDLFIKIMIEGKIIGQCLQYKDYSKWYTEVYQPQLNTGKEVSPVSETSSVEIKTKLALNKI